MSGTHHLFAVTRGLLKIARLICLFLIVTGVVGLRLATPR